VSSSKDVEKLVAAAAGDLDSRRPATLASIFSIALLARSFSKPHHFTNSTPVVLYAKDDSFFLRPTGDDPYLQLAPVNPGTTTMPDSLVECSELAVLGAVCSDVERRFLVPAGTLNIVLGAELKGVCWVYHLVVLVI
jgi:hypothetical protein